MAEAVAILSHITRCAISAQILFDLEEYQKKKNNPPVFQQRLCWDRFMSEKTHRNEFVNDD
jgi:hypothetical protein